MKELKFVDILSVDAELQERVRQWRNKARISKFMLTRHIIRREEHFKWIASLRKNDNQKFWIVYVDDLPIGSVYLQNINYRQLNSEWGFYIAEDVYMGKGFGKRIVYKLLQHFFETMRFDILNTKVFADNAAALNIYRKFRFTEIDRTSSEGGRKIVTLSFSRADWENYKRELENVCL
jgi:UDP-4-amino-4,6-dideoxy-N-acetyl-beta-L-altrosamine N-acetyltransferase